MKIVEGIGTKDTEVGKGRGLPRVKSWQQLFVVRETTTDKSTISSSSFHRQFNSARRNSPVQDYLDLR